MSLNPIKSGLRTIHNGSNDVAKVGVVVAAGVELTVSDALADQILRNSSAFKEGQAPPTATGRSDAPDKPDKPSRATKAKPEKSGD